MPTLESLQEQIDDLKRQNQIIIDSLALSSGIEKKAFSSETDIEPEVLIESEKEVAEVIVEKENKTGIVEKENKTGLEEKIGKKWFAFIGIFAIVFGIGFFVKYLSDNGFLGPIVRITLGFFASVFLIVGGEIASRREKYARWGKVLVGGGLAALYFVVYAAYNFIEYREVLGISQNVDIVLLLLVALATIGFSLKDNSQIVAAEAIVLGLTTCLLSSDFGYLMLVYNLFLALAMTTVAVYKKWSILGLASIFGTFIVYAFWRGSNDNFSIGALFLIFYFLCYIIQIALIAMKDKSTTSENRIIISGLANSILFFVAGMELVRSFHSDYDALFCLLLSAFHLGIFGLAFFFNREKISKVYFYLGVAFLAIAIPLYFEKSLITIAWSVLNVVMLATFLKTKYRPLEYLFYCLSFFIAWKVLLFDSQLDSFSWGNFSGSTRALAFFAAAACFYLGYFLVARNREKLTASFQKIVPYFYASVPTLILAVWPLFEDGENSQVLTICWSVILAGVVGLSLIKRFSEFRAVALTLGVVIFLKMFFYDLVYLDWFQHLSEDWRLIAYAITAAIFYFAYVAVLPQKESLPSGWKSLPIIYSWLGIGALFVMLWLELSGYWISVGWAILALVSVALGFIFNKRELRYQGIAVLIITIFKVFLYDTSKLESIYRTISFMVLGAILLASSFLYNKYKDKIKEIL
ncbi:MAG: DUF2339 domain-containing protein [Patescibacteria group bacterium]|jgi:uncharacterized membrane protein